MGLIIHVYSMNLSDMISHDRPGGYSAYVSGAGAGFSGHRDQMPMGHSVIPPADSPKIHSLTLKAHKI